MPNGLAELDIWHRQHIMAEHAAGTGPSRSESTTAGSRTFAVGPQEFSDDMIGARTQYWVGHLPEREPFPWFEWRPIGMRYLFPWVTIFWGMYRIYPLPTADPPPPEGGGNDDSNAGAPPAKKRCLQ